MGIVRGTKVAILSINMPHWGNAYFAIASVGAVVVPFRPVFHGRKSKIISIRVQKPFFLRNPIGKLSLKSTVVAVDRIEDFTESMRRLPSSLRQRLLLHLNMRMLLKMTCFPLFILQVQPVSRKESC
jgi:acyl-CoA synthetase (AMP-forming)/AMP-acid ligase II